MTRSLKREDSKEMLVVTRNFSHGSRWIPGFITKITDHVRRWQYCAQTCGSDTGKIGGKGLYWATGHRTTWTVCFTHSNNGTIGDLHSVGKQPYSSRIYSTHPKTCYWQRQSISVWHSAPRCCPVVITCGRTCATVTKDCVQTKLSEGLWVLKRIV